MIKNGIWSYLSSKMMIFAASMTTIIIKKYLSGLFFQLNSNDLFLITIMMNAPSKAQIMKKVQLSRKKGQHEKVLTIFRLLCVYSFTNFPLLLSQTRVYEFSFAIRLSSLYVRETE